jgi:mannose-1-phosphate guanylyltransferase
MEKEDIMNKLYCLIMAGGSGTRFWPRSRTSKPKQYLNLFGSESLLESTVNRFGKFMDFENIYIVSGRSQSQVLEEQTPTIPKGNLIYEPVGKNTLPCIGLAAMFAEMQNPNGIMVVSPSDHLIQDEDLFRDAVLAASKIADEKDGIVTIGISPSYPATGYGYIQVEKELMGGEKIRQFKVKRFVEKPGFETASGYLSQGGFYWNSGLFIFKISVFIDSVRKFAPELYKDLRKIQSDIGTPNFEDTLDTIYRAVEGISVDYGIMEHAQNIYLVEGNFPWNDLGSWESVYLFSEKDEKGNAGTGEKLLIDTRNSYAYTDEGVVAVIGLDDVIVVREGNAVLICKREKAEDVKMVVDQLKRNQNNLFL